MVYGWALHNIIGPLGSEERHYLFVALSPGRRALTVAMPQAEAAGLPASGSERVACGDPGAARWASAPGASGCRTPNADVRLKTLTTLEVDVRLMPLILDV